jgi:phosphate transport system substrate-binding protein
MSAFASACGGGAESASNAAKTTSKLTLTGSSTVAPLAAEIGKRFETKRAGLQVDVQTGGSSRGVTDAQQGLADIGNVSRKLSAEEQATGLIAHTIALDGICVILNRANPINELTKQQITDIYTGKITNWTDVGGKDAPITVINKDEGRSTLELFLSFLKIENKNVKASAIIGDNEQGIKTVAGNPDAIGYVSIGTAEFDAANGAAIKLLPMNGVAASVENVRNGTFPLSRPLNLVTKGQPTGLAKEFVEYAKSADVQDLVKEQYFVSVASAAK